MLSGDDSFDLTFQQRLQLLSVTSSCGCVGCIEPISLAAVVPTAPKKLAPIRVPGSEETNEIRLEDVVKKITDEIRM